MALNGKGTVLEYGDTADIATAATWTPLALVTKIKPVKRTASPIDSTHLESETEESMPGLSGVSDLDATLQYDAEQAEDLYALFNTMKAWRIVYPNTSGRKWNGFITEDGEDEVVNGDLISQTVKIKATGDSVRFTTSS